MPSTRDRSIARHTNGGTDRVGAEIAGIPTGADIPLDGVPVRPPGFSHGLGFLRGVAALVVVVFHGLLLFRIGAIDDAYRMPVDLGSAWLSAMHVLLGVFNGPACVTLFFVLSGTVLALSLERDDAASLRTVVAYWIRRGFRLYPLLILGAATGALLQLHYFTDETYAAAATWLNLSYKVPEAEVGRAFVTNALGLSSSLNSPAWSIKIEIAASVVFPALFLLARRNRTALVTLGVLVALMLLWPTERRPLAYVPVFLASFFVGALVPRWGGHVAHRFSRMTRPARWTLVGLILVLLMFADRILAPTRFVSGEVALIETLAAGVLVTLILFGPDRRFYRAWPVRTLGEISYGVYLLHLIVMNVVAFAVLPHLPTALAGGEAVALSTAMIAVTLAITLPLAYAVYRFVERPLQQFGRALSRHALPARTSSGVVPAPAGAAAPVVARIP